MSAGPVVLWASPRAPGQGDGPSGLWRAGDEMLLGQARACLRIAAAGTSDEPKRLHDQVPPHARVPDARAQSAGAASGTISMGLEHVVPVFAANLARLRRRCPWIRYSSPCRSIGLVM